jgi:hypothetical protein
MPTDPILLPGTNAKVQIAPITGGANPVVGTFVTLANASWTLNRKNATKDVSNARDGRKRIPTLNDYTGSFTGWYEDAAPPQSNFKEGGPYSIKLFIDATRFYQLSILLSGLDIDTQGVEDAIKVSSNFEQESGTLTETV